MISVEGAARRALLLRQLPWMLLRAIMFLPACILWLGWLPLSALYANVVALERWRKEGMQ